MQTILCTIETGTSQGEDFWIIKVPAEAVEHTAERFSELLSGTRKRIVFLDRKTELTLTADSAAYNGRSVPITKDFLECLKNLFSTDIRPGISHLDWEFSDKYSNLDLTICIGDMRYMRIKS